MTIMSRTIFVAPIGSKTGKTAFCLGLISSLKRIVSSVGFMKPVGQRYQEKSRICEDTKLIAAVFGLEADGTNLCPISAQSFEKRILEGQEKQVLDNIAFAHESITADRDIVVLEGIDMTSMGAYQTDLNVSIAERLNAQVLLLVNGAEGRPLDGIVYEAVHAKEAYEAARCRILGVVVNSAPQDALREFEEQVRKHFKKHALDVIGVIPFLPILSSVSMRDIAKTIDGEVIVEGDMRRHAQKVIVAAMRPTNALAYLEENTLVITPGDRDDILLAIACADLSDRYPSVAGIILTGNIRPDDVIIDLIRGIGNTDFPVVLTTGDTFSTAAIIDSMDIHIHRDDATKIETARTMVETYCDYKSAFVASGITVERERTPQDYLDEIIHRAKKESMHIVLPEGTDERVVSAAAQIQQRGIARVTLLGKVDVVRQKAEKLGVSIREIELKDPMKENVEKFAERLYKLRKDRGMGIHEACDLVRDTVYYGIMMVEAGDADGLVSGAIHSTADTLRPGLQVIGMAPGVRFVSSVFLMLKGAKAFFYGDCAVIEDPDKEQLAAIAVSSAQTAKSFGIKPVVAMLSYSTGPSGKGLSVEKVREATELARTIAPDIPIEGPLQYDAAFDEEVARLKLSNRKVAGRVNVFIFPDLNSGNIAYKAVQREAGAIAIGPICQGFHKPVNDLSRGCSAEDIVYLTAVTAVQAQRNS